MREQTEQEKIRRTRKDSYNSQTQLVLENDERREYFRFQDGKVVEYDLTKINFKQVRLTHEEKEALRKR